MTIHKLDRREATRLSKEKRSNLPFSFATATANGPAPTAQRSNRNRASTASRAPPRTPPRPRSDAVAVTGTAIHTIQANCPPHSPKIVRAHARSKSPVHTSVSHGESTVEVHTPPRSARSSPVSDPSREMEVCPTGSIDITSSLTSLSRKRPAPVSPGKRSGRSTSGSDRSPGHDASPKPRRIYSLQSRATDFPKSAPSTNSSGSSGAIPKRARRSELRVEAEVTRSTSVFSDGASSLPPAPSHLIPYSSDSDSCSDILMTVSNDSLSSEVSQHVVQTHCPKKGDLNLLSASQIDTVPLSRGDARVESSAIGGTASVFSPGSARLSPELIPRDADHRGDALQVTPINASTDPTLDTPVEAPSEPEVSLLQCGVPDNPPSVRTDADISNVLPVGSRASQPSAPVTQPSTLGSQPNAVEENLKIRGSLSSSGRDRPSASMCILGVHPS